MPESSVAHFQNSSFFSQGIPKSPIFTSFTSSPSTFGLLQGQQNQATILAEFFFSRFLALISFIIFDGESKIRNSIFGSYCAISERCMSKTLSSHCKYASDPEQRNCVFNSNSAISTS